MDTKDTVDRTPPSAPRVDGYLSRKAQRLYPGALVHERADGGRWILERVGQPDVALGANFFEARQALNAIVSAERGGTQTVLPSRTANFEPGGFILHVIENETMAYARDAVHRVMSSFDQIGEEAKEFSEARPGSNDVEGFEEAFDDGIEYYQVLVSLRDHIAGVLAVGLHSLLEGHKNGLTRLLRAKGRKKVTEPSGLFAGKLKELRVLANALKHPGEATIRALWDLRPELFLPASVRSLELEHPSRTAPDADADIHVDLSDLQAYEDAVFEYWEAVRQSL